MTAVTRFGAFVFRYRDGLFPVVLGISLLVGLPQPVESVPSLGALAVLVGAPVAMAGEALRLWVIGYAYIVRGGRDGKAYADDLVREGLFAHARHPLYTGNLMIAGGLWLMYGTWFTVLVVIPLFLFVYVAMALNEEEYLIGEFGDEYLDYMASVNRFLPDLRGISQSLEGWTYDWRRALRKDYGQIALPLWAIVLLGSWRMRLVWPWVVPAGVAAVVVIAIAYVVVRTLKLRGRLEAPAP
jgi:protein-S-isoprenylcysteine O-methyltransferase Ste14